MFTMHVHRQYCHSWLHMQVYEEGESEGAKASGEFKLNSSLVTPPETVTCILYVLKYKKWPGICEKISQVLIVFSNLWVLLGYSRTFSLSLCSDTVITALEACSANVNGQMRAGLLEPSSPPPCIKSMFTSNCWSSWAVWKEHWALQAPWTGSQ